MSLERNLLVGQSGGPTTVINASLAGIISAAIKNENITAVYGSVYGIQGVLNENITDLTRDFAGDTAQIERLKHTPSMYLGSCRYKLPPLEDAAGDYDKIFEVFSRYSIHYFLYIGGNDSMDTASKLSAYAEQIGYDIRIIGVPKTIDNDLMEIDHTPGFGSAAKYIAASVLEMAHDTYIYDLPSVLIIEIMGRNAGWLTASSVLARNCYNQAPHLIYLPETPFSTSVFIQDVKEQLGKRSQVIIAVSEGIKDTEGEYISAQASRIDQFGHIMLSGTGSYLEGLVSDAIGCKVRSVELNVLQRCAAHISSYTDIEEAFRLGEEAVLAAVQGQTGVMVTLNRVCTQPYQVSYGTASIDKIANMEKKIPASWITPSGNDVTNELIQYLIPLIQGEVPLKYNKGLPDYLFLKKESKYKASREDMA